MSKKANFTAETLLPDRVVLRDIGPWDEHLSITNDAEGVVESVAPMLHGRRLFYYNSEGDLTELLVVEGRFAGFR